MLNNYIILTGASGNIGNKLAYFLLNRGYALIITSRNIKHLEEMQNMFQEYKNSIVSHNHRVRYHLGWRDPYQFLSSMS